MAQQPDVKLSDGNSIPQLGLGVWQVPPEITARVVADGIEVGYRSIDTAEGYNNEEGVGQAVAEAEVPRSELFITSKLRNGGHAYDDAMRSFDESMRKLRLEQLDLFLIHWPLPSVGKYVEAWKALVQLQRDGRIRSIGVSNFHADHLERIIGETGVVPVVLLFEIRLTGVGKGERRQSPHLLAGDSQGTAAGGQNMEGTGRAPGVDEPPYRAEHVFAIVENQEAVPAGEKAPRVFGSDEGAFTVPDDFDSPLDDDVLATFT